MRPIRLTLQAFGPFATREVVDFREALEAGLFGVYGQTGAGKSTLFSAMSFALFGAPTKTDQDARSLRSDHASPDLPTEVEFVFELGAKTYLIRRRPAQERRRTRGEGMTEDAAEAWLFDATGIALDDLGSETSGEVIAEKKLGLVKEAVEARLGYGVEQFRQIVLLPQGKFETFLAAKTDARVHILRDLFDVSVYRNLANRLQEEASEAEREVKNQRAVYVARLTERGFESEEALELGIAQAQTAVEEKTRLEEAARAADEVARKALSEAERVEAAFATAATAGQAYANLNAKSEEMNRIAQRVAAINMAIRANDLEIAWQRAVDDTRTAKEAANKAKGRVATAAKASIEAAGRLAEVRASDGKRLNIQANLTRLEEIEGKVAQATGLRQAFDEAARVQEAAEKAWRELERDVAAMKHARDTAEAALEAARKNEGLRVALTSDLAVLDRALEKVVAFETARAVVNDAEGKVTVATEAARRKVEEAQRAETVLAQAEERLARTQALILAEKLTQGAPCPVCGSSDHPAPAYGTPEQSGLTDAFRKAQEAARLTREAKATADSNLKSYEVLLEERRRALAQLVPSERAKAALEADRAELNVKIADIGAAVDLQDIAGKLSGLKQELLDADAAQVTAREVVTNAVATLSEAKARRDAVVDGLPEALRTPEAVARQQAAWQEDLARLAKALEQAEAEERTAAEALTRAQEQYEAAKATLAAQEERDSSARTTFLARLAETALDEAGYAKLKPYFAGQEADQKAVEAHREAVLAAKTTWDNAQAACADRDRTDLAPLHEAKAATELNLRAASEARAEAKTQIESLKTFKASLAEALWAFERLEAETGPLRGLADLANGRNDYKMTLEAFAIGAMFDEVLEAANMRLDPMTRGRYRLMRGIESTGGRGKRGLEIEVFDINTGKARPTATLSGGETFIAALALALGLADVVESLSGKISMDTIFIDEGFGSLDTENGTGTLDQVIQVLGALTKGSRAVGLISHVGLVQEAIPQGFYVRSGPSGSKVEARRGLG